uniref:Myb-like domain-containing protein n=1 Tax=Polytomella parva TaxID=51329 RepID=A0A7S0UMB0_9CHLO|mmetsp:Transcript_1462/g.2105  ORF Transcript_1462/g.2105 Transcript_1462/m.2105 type:complete len:167 (+) Transcript_1462:141-641(+)|eukprot:CAMPEP_0175064928 /NCGR_PEP_ID=MMETSP0052_2-20121109/15621_1 /TAXON_ID=51329 ORGANISM="Polytomella parva, Strain SAG 63-3" /NCGR_SAMPLE_ID=MMETSP0052_2 /ASSEMBLY_ACC=CAM_ASM_000194 /LENGTH=166 /DNA_ID=CAMNT_0016331365 /DNA_START=118 /DNA_END=618 /DNA_ORIENTATION=+
MNISPTPIGVSDERWNYVVEMRRNFSPAGVSNDDGSINQEFFKPQRVILVQEKKWGEAEREALYKGLQIYGVGKWRQIATTLLPLWDEQQLRIRSAKLLGTQSLARYVGWKGDKAAVDASYAFNKRVGEITGCWKAGTLVENDSQSVAKYLEEIEAKGEFVPYKQS